MVEVCELTKSYSDLRRGELVALAGVSFVARPGETFGLLGPNGAGKTSILRILSTVLRPTSGKVEIADIDVEKEPVAAKMKLGFIPDRPFIYEKLTGAEFLRSRLEPTYAAAKG